MKRVIINVLMIIGIISISCEKINNPIKIEDQLLQIRNEIISECKFENNLSNSYEVNKLSNIYENESQYLELKFSDSNFLKINHNNVWFICNPSIDRQARIESGSIIYSETDTFGLLNCACRYDLSCEIGPLQFADYEFKYYRAGDLVINFNFEFNESTHLIKNINYNENNN
jgi:hypothetical protein